MNNELTTRINNLQSELKNQQWYKRLFNAKNRRKTIRYSLLFANLTLLTIVVAVVLQNPSAGNIVVSNAIIANDNETSGNPLDTLSSADIAVSVAQVANLPETVSVINHADTVNAQLAVAPSDNLIVAQPQIIATALKSKDDIQTYTVQEGDTVASVAQKFGVTSDTIKWSNNLTSDTLRAGTVLTISPVNGLVYTVVAGDTVDGIASRFSANKEQLVAFNDLESGNVPVGQKIVVPDGKPPAARGGRTTTASTAGIVWRGGGGSYDRGWCTYYAAARSGAPGGWGNARTWHIYAALAGWTVSTIPRVGAIAQTSANHVGIVEAVSPDGTMIKYSDMNGLAGFNRVGYSDWVPTYSRFQRFIYR